MTAGSGTRTDPWQLTTANGGSHYQMWRDETGDPPALVCQVGGTQLRYHLRAIEDLHAWLKGQGDWVPLGGADEQKAAPQGSVEAFGRSEDNPVGGWYGLKKGLRGRFGVYLPPLLEALGLAELEHNAKSNRVRAR
ncbi:MAG: hypothetical protein MUC54_01420 [Chloroflexi bacterium]|nr:hypothetical protein [Chloroflexota bacterium]